jgi:hypothetical protein
MRTLTLILLLTCTAHAQIQDLATTSDGAQLYFSTTQRLKGTDLRENSKILRYLDGGFELFAYVKPERVLSFYCCDLTRPQVSGNGQTVAYSSIRSCFGGSACFDFNPNSAQIRGTYNKSFSDSITLSPDGRYVVITHSFRTDRHTSIVDNASGVETRLGSSPDYAPIGGSQSIATDGTVLVSIGGIASL